MVRPSLAAEREAEMLAALEECIVEYGIAGLTVQKIADRSGYSRGHVRHYLGNKSDQINALIRVYTERYASSLATLVSESSGDPRVVILNELFGDTWLESRPEDDVVLDHLAAYAASHPESGITLAPLYEHVAETVAATLADPDTAMSRAKTLVALAYGVSALARVGLVTAGDAKQYARELLGLESA